MGKVTLSGTTSVANLILKFTEQLINDGWLQVGSSNIYASSEDADGRVCYIEAFEDTLGQFMVQMSPTLDAQGTAWPDPWYLMVRGCNYSTGDWDLYSTAQSFFLAKGNLNNSQRVWGGRYDVMSGVNFDQLPWCCFITGCRRENSATAYTNYLIGKGNSELRVSRLWGPPWIQGNVSILSQTGTTGLSWQLSVGWEDSKLACHKPFFHVLTGTDIAERPGIVGRVPDVIGVSRSVDLTPGDTVTLEDGVKYEFREHTLYWDEYLQYFLLWRMN